MRAHQDMRERDDDLIRMPEVNRRTGLSKSEIYRRIRLGLFPSSIRLGYRTAAWTVGSINAWKEKHIARGIEVAERSAKPENEKLADKTDLQRDVSEKNTQISDKAWENKPTKVSGKDKKKTTHDDLMDFFHKFIDLPSRPEKTKRLDAVEAILNHLGGTRIRDLPEDQWDQAIAYGKEFLENGRIEFGADKEEDEKSLSEPERRSASLRLAPTSRVGSARLDRRGTRTLPIVIDHVIHKERIEDGGLYKLLERALPEYRTLTGALDVKRIADEIGLTSEGVYKWLRADKLRGERARQLIKIANRGLRTPTCTETDFLPFLA